MKFLQLAAGTVSLVTTVLVFAGGTPDELEAERAKLEAAELDRAELEQTKLLEQAEQEKANLQNGVAEQADVAPSAVDQADVSQPAERQNLDLNGSEPLELGAANTDQTNWPTSTVGSTALTREADLGGNTIQIYASDKAAQFTYERLGSVFNIGNSRADVNFLFSETRDAVLSGSILYDVYPDFIPGLRVSLGGRAYAGLLGVENQDAIAVGGIIQGHYTIDVLDVPVNLSGGLGFAPDILTFGSSDRIIDWNVRAGVDVTEKIDVFVGFRFLQFDTIPGDVEADDRLHIGLRWKFGQ